jgi:hypothetical protein
MAARIEELKQAVVCLDPSVEERSAALDSLLCAQDTITAALEVVDFESIDVKTRRGRVAEREWIPGVCDSEMS